MGGGRHGRPTVLRPTLTVLDRKKPWQMCRVLLPIPKGLCPSAQGCRNAATLGKMHQIIQPQRGLRLRVIAGHSQPKKVKPSTEIENDCATRWSQPRWGCRIGRLTQGSRTAATLGCRAKSRGDFQSSTGAILIAAGFPPWMLRRGPPGVAI
jgi:hypothetical protein